MLLEWKSRHELPLRQSHDGLSHLAAPPPSVRFPIRRAEPLAWVEQSLKERGRIALVGMSGSGKSELARQWFASQPSEYAFRWWLRGHDRDTLVNDLAALAPFLGIADAQAEAVEVRARTVQEALEGLGPWLLVIDNAAGPDDFSDLLPKRGGHLIVTSQDQSWAGLLPTYEVTAFSDQEALQLLRNSPALERASAHALDELVGECLGHPLVLEQAAGYIARTGIDLASYIELLRSRRPETIDRSAGTRGGRLAASVRAALDRVGADARDILAILSQVAPAAFEIWSVPDLGEPSADGRELGVWDRLRLEDALASLRAFSLVHRDGKQLAAHELVTEVVRSSLSEVDRYRAFSCAVWTLVEQLPDRPSESFEWPTMERLVPHALALLDRYAQLSSAFPAEALARILDRLAVYFDGRGEKARARALFERGVQALHEQGLTHSGTYASLTHNFANHLSEEGDQPRAEEMLREAIAVKELVYGDEALLVGISYGALGAVLERLGDAEGARASYERAASIYSRHEDDGWSANALIDLAGVALRRGDAAEAGELLRRAISRADSATNAIPEAITGRLHLAQALASSGDLASAVRMSLEARRIADEAQAPVQLATALTAQGRYLCQMGLTDAGVRLLKRALGVWETLQPAEPVRSAITLGDYGGGLLQAGMAKLALEPLQESQAQLEELLPHDHETVAIARLLTAKAHLELGECDSARAVLRVLVGDASPSCAAVQEGSDLLGLLTAD